MGATIGFTGDIMSHLGFVIQEWEGQPFREFFSEPVRQLCRAQDEMWGNLEGPARRSEDGLALHHRAKSSGCRYPKLFFPGHYIPALVELNFKVLGIANNHSFDFETPDDTQTTNAILKEHGIAAPGLCFDPVVREVGGLSFAIIATTSFLNPPGGTRVALITDRTWRHLLASVRRWRARVDYVVVMTHWGCDYQASPPSQVRWLARELLEAGARVIYGNHPHVLWPVEQSRPDRLVCYSMGNFSQVSGCGTTCTDHSACVRPLHGGILSVEFERDRIRPILFPIFTEENYREWFAELRLSRSYWMWTAQDLKDWKSTLPRRRLRLSSRAVRNGPPLPVPLTRRDLRELQRWMRPNAALPRTGGESLCKRARAHDRPPATQARAGS